MFTSIRWRITGVYVLLTLASIVLLSVLFLQFAKSFYADNLRSQLSAQAHLVADDLSAYSFEPAAQGASLDAVAKQIGRQLGTRITIIDKSGVVLGDSMENPAAMENHATRPEVAAALKGDLGNSQRHSTTTGEDMLYVAVPVVSKGSIIGVARASIPLTAMDAPLSDFGRTILLVAAGTIAAAALVSFQMARLTTRPLKQLTVMARSIAGGHLNQRVHVSLRDEVAELAEAFNEMAARLGETLQAISTEKSKLEVILANMADAVLLTDQGGRVTLVNPAGEQLLGIKRTEVLGRSLIEAVRDHEVAEIVESCLLQKEPRSGMVEDARARRLLRVVATPVGGDGGPTALVIVQNLTELRRLETTRRDFVANISHELRTPLASIKAVAETLEDGAIDNPEVARKFLASMNREIDELSQMVRELLELSRIESGQVPLKLAPVDLNVLIRQATDRLNTQADRKQLEIAVNVPDDLPDAAADAERVEQVMINLLHNAIKFTDNGGRISISAWAQENFLAVSVTDTGIGIPREDLERIFERFYKVDRARSSGGTGLGLAIAKHIVQAHGGHIWAESSEDRGSTFAFTLPTADPS